MPDTTPDRPADQLHTAAVRARETGDPLHFVAAGLLEVTAQSAPAASVDETARAALAVARQLLGTTNEDTAAVEPCGSLSQPTYSGEIMRCVLPVGHPRQCQSTTEYPWVSWPSPTAQADLFVTEMHRLALSEALGLGTGAPWDAIRERAAELAAAPPAPADRAAEAKAATTITRLRAERAELNRQLDCLRGDMRDMEHCLREQDAEFERIRRTTGEAQPTRRLTPNEHDRAWHAIEGTAGEDGADPGTVLNAVLHALRIDAPTAAEEQAASPRRRLAGEAAAGAHHPTTTADPLADCATEYHVPVPEHGGVELLVRRQALAHGTGWAVSTRARGGGRAWTTEGWQDSISALSVDRLFCWPDPATAVDAARRALTVPAAPEVSR